MTRPVRIEARLAPMPAMARAMELLAVTPMPEHVWVAMKVLKAAYRQAETIADAERQSPAAQQTLRGIFGADVEADWSDWT